MGLTETDLRILRVAARSPGGFLLHFEGSPEGNAYLLVGGQRLDLDDPEILPRLLTLGYLEPEMGCTLRLTVRGRAVAESLE